MCLDIWDKIKHKFRKKSDYEKIYIKKQKDLKRFVKKLHNEFIYSYDQSVLLGVFKGSLDLNYMIQDSMEDLEGVKELIRNELSRYNVEISDIDLTCVYKRVYYVIKPIK